MSEQIERDFGSYEFSWNTADECVVLENPIKSVTSLKINNERKLKVQDIYIDMEHLLRMAQMVRNELSEEELKEVLQESDTGAE